MTAREYLMNNFWRTFWILRLTTKKPQIVLLVSCRDLAYCVLGFPMLRATRNNLYHQCWCLIHHRRFMILLSLLRFLHCLLNFKRTCPRRFLSRGWSHSSFNGEKMDLEARETPAVSWFCQIYTSGGVFSVILGCHSSSVEVVIQGGNSNTENDSCPKPSTLADLQPDGYEVVFARQVCRKLSLLMECMRNDFPWLRNMKYEMCVICPVCSRGKVVALCQTHRAKKCNEEQCLHFWRVSQLCSDTENISCTRSVVARSTKVQVMQFSPWFPSSIQQVLTLEQ